MMMYQFRAAMRTCRRRIKCVQARIKAQNARRAKKQKKAEARCKGKKSGRRYAMCVERSMNQMDRRQNNRGRREMRRRSGGITSLPRVGAGRRMVLRKAMGRRARRMVATIMAWRRRMV